MNMKNIVFSALMIGAISLNSGASGMGLSFDVAPLVAGMAGGFTGAGAGLILGAQKGYAWGAKTSLGSSAGAVLGGAAGAVSAGVAGIIVACSGLEIVRAVRKKIEKRQEMQKHRAHMQSRS